MLFRLFKSVLTLLCELQLWLFAMYVLAILYLQIVITPVFFFTLLGTLSLNYVEYDQALYVIGGFALIGLVVGVFWAERIRKKHGLVMFHSYLL